MFFQYTVEVNPIKYDAGAHANRRQLRSIVGFESPSLDSEILQGFLAVVAALVHVRTPH